MVAGVSPGDRLAQEETFGPVAVILPVAGLPEALAVANGVAHGLVAAIHTGDARSRTLLADAVEAGIVKLTDGPLPVSAAAPFGGWKASRMGPPEHGTWDREFYARTQAAYGAAGPGSG